MTLEQFRDLSDAEICKRINEQFQLTNYSAKEVMHNSGYDFSWGSMRKEALDRGLKEGFFFPDKQGYPQSIGTVEEPEEIRIILCGKEDAVRRTISIERGDAERIDTLTENLTRSADKSAVVAAMLRYGLDAFEQAAKSGMIILERPAPQICLQPHKE